MFSFNEKKKKKNRNFHNLHHNFKVTDLKSEIK